MKYPTKQKRLIAVFDTYRKLHNKDSVSTREVTLWGLAHDLLPPPKLGQSLDACLEWERKLLAAAARPTVPHAR